MVLASWDISKARKITLDGSKIEENLVYFPMYVHLTSSGGQTDYNLSPILDSLRYNLPELSSNIDDTFEGVDGESPNLELWRITSGTPTIQSNKLFIDHSMSIESLPELSGDFDIQIDFNILSGPNTASWGFNLRILSPYNGDNIEVYRTYTNSACGSPNSIYEISKEISDIWSEVACSPTSDSSGKLRLVRTGSNVQGYKWNGSSWDTVGSAITFNSYNVKVIIRASNWDTNPAFSGEFANFKLNSGTLVLPTCYDSFAGSDFSTPDTAIWETYGDITPYIYNGTLTCSGSGYGEVGSRFRIEGDFTVQIDYQALGFLDQDTASLELAIWDSYSDDIFSITRQNWSGGDRYIFKTRISGGWTDRNYVATTDTTGRFRLVRSGTTAYAYYWFDDTWTLLGSYNMGSAGLAKVLLAHSGWASNPVYESRYDNFELYTVNDYVIWTRATYPNRKKIAFAPRFDYEILEETVNDDFYGITGNPPRADLWEVILGTPTIQNNRLRHRYNGGVDSIGSIYKLFGDFDIQVDYDITAQPTTDWWFSLLIYDGGINRIDTTRRREGGTEKYEMLSYDGSWTRRGNISTSDTTGSLRIVRVGTTFTSYKYNGTSWDQIGTFSFTNMDGPVFIRTETTGTNPDVFTVLLNNFFATSANIAWPPNVDVWDDTYQWDLARTKHKPYSYNNKILLTIPYNATASDNESDCISKFKLVGDFEFQIDYDLGETPVEYGGYSTIILTNSNTSGLGSFYYFVRRENTGGTQKLRVVVQGVKTTLLDDSSITGTYRFIRSGNTIYVYSTPEWTLRDSYTFGNADDLYVVLRADNWGPNYPDINCYLSNFTLISGTLSWPSSSISESLFDTPESRSIQTHNMYKDTQLYCEIADWDINNNSAELWVNLPVVSSGTDTELFMYYDTSHTDNDSTYLSNTVLDSFTSTDYNKPDNSLWEVFLPRHYFDIRILDNKLNFRGANRKWPASYSYLRSRFGMQGDFDIFLSFENLTLTSPANGIGFELVIQKEHVVDINRCYMKAGYDSGSGGDIFATDYVENSSNRGWHTASRSNDYGGLRISRSGSTVICYYKDGSGNWSSLYTWTNAFTDTAFILLAAWVPTSGGLLNVDINNFTVASGTVAAFVDDTGSFIGSRVWDDNYTGVYHLSQNPTLDPNNILDSTFNFRHGSTTGSMTYADSIISSYGKALDFDGSDDGIILPAVNMENLFTIEATFDSNSSNTQTIIANTRDTTCKNYAYVSLLDTDVIWGGFRCSNDSDYDSHVTEIPVTLTEPHTYSVSCSPTGARSLLDGVASDSNSLANAGNADGVWYIGKQDTTGSSFSGLIYDVKFSNVERPQAWKKASAYTILDNFISYSLPVSFYFSNVFPTLKDYGLTSLLRAVVTVSGENPSYAYDTQFYFSSALVDTISGTDSGTQVSSSVSTPSGISYSWYMVVSTSGYSATSPVYEFDNAFLCQGYTEEFGTRISGVPVRLYRRDNGILVGEDVSSTVSGIFSIETTHNGLHYAVALHNSQIRNAVIADWLEVI